MVLYHWYQYRDTLGPANQWVFSSERWLTRSSGRYIGGGVQERLEIRRSVYYCTFEKRSRPVMGRKQWRQNRIPFTVQRCPQRIRSTAYIEEFYILPCACEILEPKRTQAWAF
jgi:hypothetical protein